MINTSKKCLLNAPIHIHPTTTSNLGGDGNYHPWELSPKQRDSHLSNERNDRRAMAES